MRQYGWDYPPNPKRYPDKYVEEMIDQADDIAVLTYTPEELAHELLKHVDSADFEPAARRYSRKLALMHGDNVANRYRAIINDASAVYEFMPIRWNDEIE